MHPVEKVLLENINNPRAIFIFPTDVASSRWADQLLRLKGGGTIAMDRFIAWDTFKERSVRSQMQNKKSVPAVLRKMFVSGLIAENAELCKEGKKPVFSSLIRPRWAQQAASSAQWLTNLLPQLGAWFSSTTGLAAAQITSSTVTRLAQEFDGDDCDLYTLGCRYAQFLDQHGLFEPAWEKPPFNDSGAECFIFFPDCLVDYSEYRELLEASGRVRAIYSTEAPEKNQKHDFFFYTNSRSEISEAALYIRSLHERKNIRWDSIAVSIGNAEKYEPYVLREFKLRNIPFVRRTGKSLASHPAAQFFAASAHCVSQDFSLDAVNKLLLNNYLPWKDPGKIQRLLEFGLNNNCIASWTENKDGKERTINVWEHAFEHTEEKVYTMERGFFRSLKLRLTALRNSSDFANLRKNYFSFREYFFNMDKCLPETDLILSRCISELGYLAEMEKTFHGVKVPDPCMFFIEYLGEVKYLARQKESGLAILPYRTAAPASFDCHIVIGASQENLSEVFSRLDFLPRYKREKLGLKDEDASKVFIRLHKANSFKQAAFFCSEKSFSGYAIPHNSLINTEDAPLPETPQAQLRYAEFNQYRDKFANDLFTAENQFLTNASRHLNHYLFKDAPVLYNVQKKGFLAWMARRTHTAEPGSMENSNENLLQLIHKRFFHEPHNKQMSVSASSLETYYQCSLIWLYERVLKLESVNIDADLMPYTISGLVYHAVLNEFFSAIKEKKETLALPVADGDKLFLPDSYSELLLISVNKVFDIFPFFPNNDEPVMSGLTARLLRAQKEQFLDNLNNFITAFISFFAGSKVIATEASYFPASQGSYVLNGRVDCVLRSPDDLGVIVDFKTKSMPAPDACKGTGEKGLADFQLPLYTRLLESSGQKEKIYTALFFSIIDKLPQVLFGRIEDKINEIKYPKKDEDLILRDDGKFNSIMNEFNNKTIQFASDANKGRFSNIESDAGKCLKCKYMQICRTVYRVGREHKIPERLQ